MNLTLTHNPNENALHFLMTKTPIDPRESVDPLERIRAEHFRQRSLCNLLIRLADDPFRRGGRQIARVARDYLAGPLVFHVTDEIDDLLPLLDARCGASDEIDRVHSILIENHLADIALADEVINEIDDPTGQGEGRRDRGFGRALRGFAQIHLRHLAWENSVMIPLARKRLTEDDRLLLAVKWRRDEDPAPAHQPPPEKPAYRVGGSKGFKHARTRAARGGPGRIRTCDNAVMSGAF